jgi:hypothetical protein
VPGGGQAADASPDDGNLFGWTVRLAHDVVVNDLVFGFCFVWDSLLARLFFFQRAPVDGTEYLDEFDAKILDIPVEIWIQFDTIQLNSMFESKQFGVVCDVNDVV